MTWHLLSWLPARTNPHPGPGGPRSGRRPLQLELLEQRLVLSYGGMSSLVPTSLDHLDGSEAGAALQGVPPEQDSAWSATETEIDRGRADLGRLLPATLPPAQSDCPPAAMTQPTAIQGETDYQLRLNDFTAPGQPTAPAAPALTPFAGGSDAAVQPAAATLRMAEPVKIEDVQNQADFQSRLDNFTAAGPTAGPSAQPTAVAESDLALVATLLASRQEEETTRPPAAEMLAPQDRPMPVHTLEALQQPGVTTGVPEVLRLPAASRAEHLGVLPPANALAAHGPPIGPGPVVGGTAAEPVPPVALWTMTGMPGVGGWDGDFNDLLNANPMTSDAAVPLPRRAACPRPRTEETAPGPAQASTAAASWLEVVSASFGTAPVPGAAEESSAPLAPGEQSVGAEPNQPAAWRGRTYPAGFLIAAVFAAGLCRPWVAALQPRPQRARGSPLAQATGEGRRR